MTPGIPRLIGLTALILAGCAGAPLTSPAVSTASTVAPSATQGDAKTPAQKAPEVENQVGNFKRTTREGKTFWCEETAFTGSKLTKTRCLTETEYAALKEANQNSIDRWNRALNDAAGDPAATGQQSPTY